MCSRSDAVCLKSPLTDRLRIVTFSLMRLVTSLLMNGRRFWRTFILIISESTVELHGVNMVTFCVPTVDYDLPSLSDISSCATPVCRQVSMTIDSNTNWTALDIALFLH